VVVNVLLNRFNTIIYKKALRFDKFFFVLFASFAKAKFVIHAMVFGVTILVITVLIINL